MSRVWFITGATSGFGTAIAEAAIARGDSVVATARNPSRPELKHLASLGATTLKLDITDTDAAIEAVVAEAVRIHGRIDILLNNAAYILEGAIEEISHAEALALFNTNVFGQLAVLRAVLPVMRKQRSGVVGNMGSIGGWRGIPAGGMYSATKFTLAGISLALKLEVADLGIDVTLIEPGYFRTDFLAGGHKATAEKRIDDLATSTAPYRRALKDYNHKQPGDPVKGAGLIVEALTKSGRCEGRGTLPGRFLMGSDAVSLAEEALAHWKKELDEWKDLAVTTDHDN